MTDARQRAARTDTSNKGIDFAIEIVVDLRPRRGFMRSRIGRVGELLRDEGIRRLLGKFFCLAIAPFMPLEPSVKTIFAPYALSRLRRSTLMVSGIVRIAL